MNVRIKGFSLVELMITSVIILSTSILVYKYWIKQTRTMSDSVIYSSLKERSNFVANSIIRDLKEIGFNPMSGTEPTTNKEFTVLDHPYPYDSILYSFYNSDSDPSLPKNNPTPKCNAPC